MHKDRVQAEWADIEGERFDYQQPGFIVGHRANTKHVHDVTNAYYRINHASEGVNFIHGGERRHGRRSPLSWKKTGTIPRAPDVEGTRVVHESGTLWVSWVQVFASQELLYSPARSDANDHAAYTGR